MEQSVKKFIRRHALIENESTVVVGVSGGPDSMALLHFLYQHQSYWKINVVACCVDHMLRGEESKEDLDFVERFCKEEGIPFVGKQVDVLAYKKEHRVSTQVAARECRYRVFEEVMKTYQASLLALAHHGDDQIETMLMRQVHGSFGGSRSGIPYKRPFANGFIIRPFLTVTKQEIELYCSEMGIVPRRDPSNASSTYVRNRFRSQVLPFLKRENPRVHLRFQLESEMLQEDQRFLEELAHQRLTDVISEQEADRIVIFVDKLIQQPLPLQRRLIHLILNYLYSVQMHAYPYHSIHIEEILYMLRDNQASGQLHLPDGLVIQRSYNQCTFFFFSQENGSLSYRYQIDEPGSVSTPLGTITIQLSKKPIECKGDLNHFICDLSIIKWPLVIRTRQNGDRISLKGMNGSKKVKDIFIDHKIPHDKREIWPIVLDHSDEILWVPGLKQSSKGKGTTSQEGLFLILSFVTYG